jgi:hypothetical protein
MTHDEALALGRRAVACKSWRWMAGMLVIQPGPTPRWGRLRNPDPGGDWIDRGEDEHDGDGGVAIPRAGAPDLRDPATLGCLLALVREAWKDPELATMWWGAGWRVACLSVVYNEMDITDERGRGAIEAEALVAALESAPP